jgi:hypothetical protein
MPNVNPSSPAQRGTVASSPDCCVHLDAHYNLLPHLISIISLFPLHPEHSVLYGILVPGSAMCPCHQFVYITALIIQPAFSSPHLSGHIEHRLSMATPTSVSHGTLPPEFMTALLLCCESRYTLNALASHTSDASYHSLSTQSSITLMLFKHIHRHTHGPCSVSSVSVKCLTLVSSLHEMPSIGPCVVLVPHLRSHLYSMSSVSPAAIRYTPQV